jgi:hypothetical protein
MRGPQGMPGIHRGFGLKSVEPKKSPGCLRVPGLFFLLSEVPGDSGGSQTVKSGRRNPRVGSGFQVSRRRETGNWPRDDWAWVVGS